MTERDFEIFNAKPVEVELDKSKVKWPRRRKFRVKRKRSPSKKSHPGTKEARQILEQAGRNLHACSSCGSTYRVAVHHRNGNPFDNRLENLMILCSDCHEKEHFKFVCVRADE